MITHFNNGNFIISQEVGNFEVLIVKENNRYSVEKWANGEMLRKYPITKAELSKEVHDLFCLPTRREMSKKWPVDIASIEAKQAKDADWARMLYVHQKWANEG